MQAVNSTTRTAASQYLAHRRPIWIGPAAAFMLNVGLPPLANKKMILSFEYGRGSGDDPATPDDEFEGYVGVSPFYPYAWAYEYRFHSLDPQQQ